MENNLETPLKDLVKSTLKSSALDLMLDEIAFCTVNKLTKFIKKDKTIKSNYKNHDSNSLEILVSPSIIGRDKNINYNNFLSEVSGDTENIDLVKVRTSLDKYLQDKLVVIFKDRETTDDSIAAILNIKIDILTEDLLVISLVPHRVSNIDNIVSFLLKAESTSTFDIEFGKQTKICKRIKFPTGKSK